MEALRNVNSGAHACPQRGRGAPLKVHAQSWPRPNKGSGTSCVTQSKKMYLINHCLGHADYPVSEDPFVLSEQGRDVPTSSTVSERGAIWVRLLVVEFVLVVVVVEAVRMLFRRTWLFVLIL